jgi:hypothetical protein
MSPDRARGRLAVFARLRADAQRQAEARVPPRYVRWLGWAISVALVAMVVVLAVRAGR